MAHKHIMVCLGAQSPASRLVRVACDMARSSEAQLTGLNLHATPNRSNTGSCYMVLANPDHQAEPETDADPEANERTFKDLTAKEGIDGNWQGVDDGGDDLLSTAYRPDMLIVAQSDSISGSDEQHRRLQKLIDRSGCPVLLIPDGYSSATVDTPCERTGATPGKQGRVSATELTAALV